MVSEVKESSDFWTIFDLFLGLFWTVLCIYCEIWPILRTLWTILSEFKPFFQEGRYLGRGIPREQKIHWYTPSERRGGKRSGASSIPREQKIHWYTPSKRRGGKRKVIWCKRHIGITLTAKGKRVLVWYTQLYGGHARPSQWGKLRPSPRRAETLTLEGANQDIKESGHWSRRPPAHKGYNQFTKDARRSQRATQLSQLKPMKGKIWSSTQTCRNTNKEWTLQIDRHP